MSVSPWPPKPVIDNNSFGNTLDLKSTAIQIYDVNTNTVIRQHIDTYFIVDLYNYLIADGFIEFVDFSRPGGAPPFLFSFFNNPCLDAYLIFYDGYPW